MSRNSPEAAHNVPQFGVVRPISPHQPRREGRDLCEAHADIRLKGAYIDEQLDGARFWTPKHDKTCVERSVSNGMMPAWADS